MHKLSLWRVFYLILVTAATVTAAFSGWFSWNAWRRRAPLRRIISAVTVAERGTIYRVGRDKQRFPVGSLTAAQLAVARAGVISALSADKLAYVARPRGILPCYSAWESGLAFEGALGQVSIDLDFKCDNYKVRFGESGDHGMMGPAKTALNTVVTTTR